MKLKYLVLSVHSISVTQSSGTRPSGGCAGPIVAPVLAALTIRTIASHMTGVTTHATDDVGGEITLLGTVVLAMTNLSTVLTTAVFIISQRSVEGGELSKLVALEFVLAFGDRSSLFTLGYRQWRESRRNKPSQ